MCSEMFWLRFKSIYCFERCQAIACKGITFINAHAIFGSFYDNSKLPVTRAHFIVAVRCKAERKRIVSRLFDSVKAQTAVTEQAARAEITNIQVSV